MMMKLSEADVINKSLFFLGAGFSYGTGCKTSPEMFSDLREKLADEQDNTFNKTQKEALKFLIACLQYHAEWRTMESRNGFTFAPNIEELALLIRRIKNRENFLPYPITGNWADKLVMLESKYSSELTDKNAYQDIGLFESLERGLRNLLKSQWLCANDNLSYLKPISDFLKKTTGEEYRLEIFTLNNDLVIEQYFSINQEIPWRGFVNGKWQGIQNDLINDPHGRIDLYKLHGSIDWVRLEDMDVWEHEKLDEEKKDNIQEKHNPYVIFGHGTKTFSVEPFFSLINHFNNQLLGTKKDYFFVIGYSFFDPYINNLLFNAVKGFKKLIIVNPHFGPRKIYSHDSKEILHDPLQFYRILYPEGTNQGDLTDYLRDIQKDAFYSELPEFNYSSISAENIEFIPLKTDLFIQKFFGNTGSMLVEYINYLEKEKLIRLRPF